MSSRRCFKAKHTVKVVSFKDGKVNRRSKLSVPIKYSERTNVHKYTSSSLPETSACGQPEVSFGGDEIVGPSFKPKRGKMRLKKKIKAYRDRKIKLGNAWLGIRQQLFSAFLEHQAMPVNQGCVIPECKESACGRCLDCGPAHFMCEEHINLVHASGQSFHYPEIWEIEKYIQYKFKEVVVWETNHNLDHGYTRDVVVVNRNGQQRLVKFKFCCHEPEAVTLMKHGLWPSSPKEPQAAFEKNLMELVKYIFLECRTSLKSICQAIYWIMPSLSPVYVKDIYRLLVGENFGEYRYLSYMLDTFGGKNVQLDNVSQCPACPKKSGNMYVSLDALFGCVRKISAGTSVRPANHGETLFIEQTKVDSFLKNYKVTSSLKSQVSCHNFQAGSNLRSKVKTKKLDETAIFGAGCRHEVPLKFFSLKRGEEIGNAVYLLKWLKESTNNKNLNIYLYYDIACTLESHLKRTNQEALLENVKVAIPTFHCYGHKVSCQVSYSGRRINGFGLSDGEVMERMWSYLRPTSKITKEMTPSHRVDALTDFLLHYRKKSLGQIGERLCDHLKKALHMKADTNEQLNLLLENLSKSGIHLNVTTIEKWSKSEKDLYSKKSEKRATANVTDVTEQYAEKLKEYYDTRAKLAEIEMDSEEFSILSSKLNSKNEQLKKIENGQQRWSQDHPAFKLYVTKAEDTRRNELLSDMRARCLERWFLLQLMKKYADGQAIAKKICGQINKTTNTIKKLVREYDKKITEHHQSKYPASVTFEEITDLNSTIWNHLEEEADADFPVPYYIRRKIIDFNHIINRSTEEVDLIKNEMARVLEFYSARVSALATWSEELRKEQESPESTGLLVMVLTEKDTLDIVLLHLNSLFAPYMDEHAALPEDDGIFLTCDEADKFEMELDDDAGNEDRESELEEENVLDILVSVLNEEYGTDYEYSDEEKSDEEDELISIKDSTLQSFS